jgi:hypothetical protein
LKLGKSDAGIAAAVSDEECIVRSMVVEAPEVFDGGAVSAALPPLCHPSLMH